MFIPTTDEQRAALLAYRHQLQNIAYTKGRTLRDADDAKHAALAVGITATDLNLERWNEAEKIRCIEPVNLTALLD